MIKEVGADNAATPPNGSDVSKIQIPVIDLARRAQLDKALRVADDLAGVEGVANRLDQFGTIAGEGLGRRPWQHFACLNAFLLEGAQDPCLDRATDDR